MKAPLVKTTLHPRNKNRVPYDFKQLFMVEPSLASFIKTNKYGVESLDFASPVAVKLLNKALLAYYYGIKKWNFPDDNLCPPIPGRADYIHYLADLLAAENNNIIPRGDDISVLDIGVGASCIYPILGISEYDWSFIGSDIDPKSLKSATEIIAANDVLKNKFTCRLQTNPQFIFRGIITKKMNISVTMCNPPFHTSKMEAQKGTQRKVNNLRGRGGSSKIELNFAGNNNELIYEGGEFQFIKNMILESQEFATNVGWFTTLVSKSEHLDNIYKLFSKLPIKVVKTIPMATGNKVSRIIAWKFN